MDQWNAVCCLEKMENLNFLEKNSFQKKLQTFYFKFLKYDLNENIAPLQETIDA
jgi:hypothetical protein